MIPILSIFIPAFNAENHLENLFKRISDDLWAMVNYVYIINDGSGDATALIIERLAGQFSKVKTVHFDQNFGYGSAVKKGIDLCKDDDCKYAVCLHADGQYPPEKIIDFINHMYSNKIDILQGSRIASGTALKGGMPLYKYIAGKILTFFENRIFGLKMTDYHSGFLLYSRNALDSIPFGILSTSFDIDLEVIASAKTIGLSIAELPIPTKYADEVSYLNPITYGVRVIGVLMKYCIGRYSCHMGM